MTGPVLVLAPERVRPTMAGMGIRAYEIARALSRDFQLRLVIPNDPAEVPDSRGLEVVSVRPEQIGRTARGCRAAVVSGHPANDFFHQAPEVPVAVDLYDPFFIENLHYARLLGPAVNRNDRAALTLALCRGDHFLCASREQRFFYAGGLHAVGRIGPEGFADDPRLEALLSVVPFGVPEESPRASPGPIRERLGARPGDPVLLFGGIYDWHDPEPLMELWPGLRSRFAGIRLVFCENPNPETTPQEAFRRAFERARGLRELDRGIFFLPWQGYGERAHLYAAATLQVVLCRPGLEAELSFRTRLLDAAWAGVPFVSSAGGGLAREMEEAGAGIDVPPGDRGRLAEAISGFLSDPAALEAASASARRFALGRTWARAVVPLRNFLFRASVSSGRLPFPASAREPSPLRRAARRARALFR